MSEMEKSLHLEAQLGVIGSLLLDAEGCAGEIFLRTREDQYTGEYRTLFAAARQLYQAGRPIDPVTVRGIAGEEYTSLILQIMDLTPTAANYQAYIDLLIEQAQVAKMQALGLALTGCKTTEEALALLEEANQAVVQQASLRVVDAAQGHLEFLERQDRKAEYLPWGFPKLDQTVLSSLGDFVILGGRPSAGKTALSLQMAWEQAKTRRVGYFSFETNSDELYDRLHALEAGVDSHRIRTRTLREEERARVITSGDVFSKRPFQVIQANGMTVGDVRSVTVAKRFEVIYVDYLQIINPGRGSSRKNRFEDVSMISMDLHGLAVSLGVLVVGLSQLSRPDRTARNKAPDLYSLRESGQIEQDADAVLLLYQTEEGNPTAPRTLRVGKNKKGLSGGYLELDFDGPTQTFREHKQDHSVQREFVDKGRAVKAVLRSNAKLVELPGKDPDLPF